MDSISINKAGISLAFVPEDRIGMGLVGDMDMTDNMMLRSYRNGKSPFLDRKGPKALALKIKEQLEVMTQVFPHLSVRCQEEMCRRFW